MRQQTMEPTNYSPADAKDGDKNQFKTLTSSKSGVDISRGSVVTRFMRFGEFGLQTMTFGL